MKKAIGPLVFFTLIFGFNSALGLHRTRMNIRYEAHYSFIFSRQFHSRAYSDCMLYKNRRVTGFDFRLLLTLGFAGYGVHRLSFMENRIKALEIELRNTRQKIVPLDRQTD